MPNDDTKEQQPETTSESFQQSESLAEVVDIAQGINPAASDSSLEERLQPRSNVSEDDLAAQEEIARKIFQIAGVDARDKDHPVRRYLEAQTAEERAAIVNDLLNHRTPRGALSMEACRHLSAINALDSLSKLKEALGGTSAQDRRDRLDAFLTFSSMATATGKDGTFVRPFLSTLKKVGSPELQKEISWAELEKSLEKEILQERVSDSLGSIISGNNVRSHLDELKAHDRAQCRTSDFGLQGVIQLAHHLSDSKAEPDRGEALQSLSNAAKSPYVSDQVIEQVLAEGGRLFGTSDTTQDITDLSQEITDSAADKMGQTITSRPEYTQPAGQRPVVELMRHVEPVGSPANDKSEQPAVNQSEAKAAARSLRDNLHSHNGASIDALEELFKGKSQAERQAIIDQYKELTGLILAEVIRVPFSGSQRIRAQNALRGDGTAVDHAGDLAAAFLKYGEFYYKSGPAKEIRSILSSCSAEELEQIKRDFPKIMRRAGLPEKSLDAAINELGEPHREVCKIWCKGADKVDYKDICRMSDLAIYYADSNLMQETWQLARPEHRQAFLDSGAREKIYAAFPGSVADRVSKSGMYLEAGKIIDVLELGFVGADKFVRQASGWTTGDFETQIDMALRNMTPRERELFIAGQALYEKGATGEGLKGEQKVAFERYKKIHDALTVAGYPYEVDRWEEIAARGGGILTDVVDARGTVWSAASDDIFKKLENMSVQDLLRLRTDKAYQHKLIEALSSYVPSDPDDPAGGPLGRCLHLIKEKCKVEADQSAFTRQERELYERGKKLVTNNPLLHLSPDERTALETFRRVRNKAEWEQLSESEKKSWSQGAQVQGDLSAREFYNKKVFDTAFYQTRRNIFDVIHDVHKAHGSSVEPVLEALANMKPNEKRMCRLAQEMKDGKVDLSKLTDAQCKEYQGAVQFRADLDERLRQVLEATRLLPGGKSEREAAQTVLERIGRGNDKPGIVEQLYVHAGHFSSDKAQIISAVDKALKDDPKLAACAKAMVQGRTSGDAKDQMAAAQLIDAMKRSLGPAMYQQFGTRLLLGTLSPQERLLMRVGTLTSDKAALFEDLASMSDSERARIADLLDPKKVNQMLELLPRNQKGEFMHQADAVSRLLNSFSPHEKQVFKSILAQGMKPEDRLRLAVGGDLDGTDEKTIKEVFAALTDREAMKKELAARLQTNITEQMITTSINERLDQLSQSFAKKYGMDLKTTLLKELGGEDLKRVLQLASRQSDNPEEAVHRAQQEFFANLGLGSAFVDFVGYGASTSLGMSAFDRITAAQAHEHMGLGSFESADAREQAVQLLETALEMCASQNELSDTAIDVSINVGCILATIPSGGASLGALAANLSSKTGLLRSIGGALSIMDKAAHASSVALRTEMLTNWFANASRAEKIIALGILGGGGKVGIKSATVSDYELANQGLQDFLSGFADMALNMDIPLNKWGSFEAVLAARQGALAGGLGALPYINPDSSVQENLASVGLAALAGGTLNLAMVLPFELAAKLGARAHLPSEQALLRLESKTDEVGERLAAQQRKLAQDRASLTPQEVAASEAAIEQQKQELLLELRAEVARHLRERFKLTDAQVNDIAAAVPIELKPYSRATGANGVFDPQTGRIEIFFGPDRPTKIKYSDTILHEFKHFINAVQNANLAQKAPEQTVVAIVEDCLKGVMGPGSRLDVVNNTLQLVPRLPGEKFSQAEVEFVKKQLKDYLLQNASSGQLPPTPSIGQLKAWLAARQPEAKFPVQANQAILLTEMVDEIKCTRITHAAIALRKTAMNDGVVKLGNALEKFVKGDQATVKHRFDGYMETLMGSADRTTYFLSSVEEMAANKAPLYAAFREHGDNLIAGCKKLLGEKSKIQGLSPQSEQFLGDLKKIFETMEDAGKKVETKRQEALVKLAGNRQELEKALKALAAEERKAAHNAARKLSAAIESDAGLEAMADLAQHPQLAQGLNEAVDALYARKEAVDSLKRLSAMQDFAEAARDARVAGQTPEQTTAAGVRLYASLKNLLAKTPTEGLDKLVNHLFNQGLVTPRMILSAAPQDQQSLQIVVDRLQKNLAKQSATQVKPAQPAPVP